jgi:DNA-directed RNA polymerase specialized sigma24 family protein
MDPTPHEYKLAQRARNGDCDAIAELVARTRTRLFDQAYADLGHYDDAQDAVAAALVKVCTSIQHLHDPMLIVPWIRAIVRNEARMLRRRQPHPLLCLEDADGLEDAGGLEDDTDQWLLRLEIEQALRELPGQQARALRLFYLLMFT